MTAQQINPNLSLNQIPVSCISDSVEVTRLHKSVKKLLSIELNNHPRELVFHKFVSAIHNLCIAIYFAEKAGYSREEILFEIRPVIKIVIQSPFIKRLHHWPNGYPGDYETIEEICDSYNKSNPGTLAYYCEMYALTSPIVQQHRNKIAFQTNMILKTIKHVSQPRILSIACGGCRDVVQILDYITGENFKLILNDFDPAALNFARNRLSAISGKCDFIGGDIIRFLKTISKKGPFDLIFAGGLFDYLSDRHIIFIIKHLIHYLNPGCTFFFTNIAKGDPYRIWREYFANWILIERSEQEILNLTQNAGVDASCVNIYRDNTGLSLFAEIRVS